VAAIDINMGCPKHFSIQGGMGAALLKNQQLACDIVRTLSTTLQIPVSAKIRLLETTEATVRSVAPHGSYSVSLTKHGLDCICQGAAGRRRSGHWPPRAVHARAARGLAALGLAQARG
jgi:hypothetical protein